jgi:hypothetical protein
MRPLCLDERAIEKINSIKQYAEENFLTIEDMLALAPIGDNPNFSCSLDFGYRVAFSVEKQPSGWARHISISVDTKNKLPNPGAVQELLPYFGIKKPLEECIIYVEEITSEFSAVNVICPIEQ